MKTFVPNYYKNFKCIAEKCKHNCCIGWEIDIDDETILLYDKVKGLFKKKLKAGINRESECSCFKLDGKGRCVFLNENNLCEIILNLGESSLCQICTDHPRFKNYFSNRMEMGLGLCCEEAARIILSQNEDFSLIELSDDKIEYEETNEEKDFFKFRENAFHKLQDGNSILTLCDDTFPEKSICEWAEIFLSLEHLDEHWIVILNDLRDIEINDISLPDKFNRYFNNLLIYFTYRHLNEFSTTKDFIFIHLSCEMIKNICRMHIKKYGNLTFEDIVDYCRMYSSEIEYSDENIEKLIEIL